MCSFHESAVRRIEREVREHYIPCIRRCDVAPRLASCAIHRPIALNFDTLKNMRLSIGTRLFLTMLLVSLMLIGGIVLAAQWRFSQGLHSYLMQQDVQRAELFAQDLAEFHAANGGWDVLRHHPERWNALLRLAALQQRQEGPPPPENMPTTEFGKPPPPHPPAFTHLARRLLLLDAQGKRVAGEAALPARAQRLPIIVNQQTVGWLAIAPPRLRGDALRERLLREQSEGLLWIGLLALLLAGVASALLARYLLQPIRRLSLAAQGLAQGDLSRRVALQRDDELGQLAAQFDRMAQALEHQERGRRAWLADVSHELRTPLAILKGEIEALQDGVRPLDARALASLREETERLDRLIDDLYQLVRAEQEVIAHNMQPLDPIELVHAAAERFRARFRQAGLEFSVDCVAQDHARVLGDAQRLHQVLANMLENSARYTQAPGRVRLHCQIDAQTATITLEDSAPGVPDAAMPRLFERFYRVESSRNREHGGAGLGLAMCQTLVLAHGGQLEAFSSTLGGLGLRLTLPLQIEKT